MMSQSIIRALRAWLCVCLLCLPATSHALACWNGASSSGSVTSTLSLPGNLYVSAAAPSGTVIWQSPLQTISVYCQQSLGENVYFWVNPKKTALAAGLQIGIIFNGQTYTQSNGAINTGIYVPAAGSISTTLQYSIVLLKTSGAPSSGTVAVSQYSVFQLDGVGGLNGYPGVNYNQLINGSVTFTPGGTCNLSAADVNRVVTLPTIGVSALPAVGSAAGSVSFTITASNCSTGLHTATFSFSGSADANNPILFANTGGTAKGVAVFMGTLGDGRNIGANSTNNTRVVDIQSQTAQLPVFVEYMRTTAVTPGTLRSVVTLNMLYQ
ncbi:hypothetical protein CEK28_12790 [Xenophilus sp. AP218F]|nr:hypothetical protein CEK28_12790 [Xenophilus sp. AP218F]